MSLEGKQIDRYAILHLLGNGTLEMASQLLTNQANLQLGSNYAPVGNITTTLTSATLTDAKSGTITLTVSTYFTQVSFLLRTQSCSRLLAVYH